MYRNKTVTVILPALNEEESIGPVVSALDRPTVDHVVVADNGSTDGTAAAARRAGATVVAEPRRGYGSACLRGLRAGPKSDIYVFLDGDGSDAPEEVAALLKPLVEQNLDLVLGSRVLGKNESGSLTPLQRLGNALTCRLVHLLWRVRYTDLGPFRAITREALERLDMRDPDFGWTIEMQVKAAQRGLRIKEVPVSHRTRRGGRSKVSGTFLGSYRAGRRILGYVASAKARELFCPPS